LVRAGSENRLPNDCRPVTGNALDRETFEGKIAPADTYVQLVGVAHPSPTKARQFREIDLKSCEESVAAAVANNIKHFVYVSVAHPAPAMKAYIDVRAQCEALIRKSGLNATILRPWYVLGPGHYWPYLLKPFYWMARQIPATRTGAERLGLVTLPQMIAALVRAVEAPPQGLRSLSNSLLSATQYSEPMVSTKRSCAARQAGTLRASVFSPSADKLRNRWRFSARFETLISPSFSSKRKLLVSVVLSSPSISPSAPMEIGCFLAMPTRMANCVERIPDSCSAVSYRRVTARAILRKFNEAQ
jgi:hypothetical protein